MEMPRISIRSRLAATAAAAALKIFNGGGYGVVTAGAPCGMPEA